MNESSAHEDLAVVRQLMEEARGVAWQYANHIAAWGVIVAAALLLTYSSSRGGVAPPIGWTWVGALLVGWMFSVWSGRREASRARVRITAERVLGGIWIAFGITASLMAVLGLYTPAIEVQALAGIMAALLGFSFFASSFVGHQRWMRWLALGWWVGAVGMLLRPGPHTLPFMAGLVVLLQVLPGIVLRRRGKVANESVVP